jgi:hypothetical protein
MLQNSKYSVWFRTPKGEGHGIISLTDGNLSGGDNISSYTGPMFRTVVNLLPPSQSSGIRADSLLCSASTM